MMLHISVRRYIGKAANFQTSNSSRSASALRNRLPSMAASVGDAAPLYLAGNGLSQKVATAVSESALTDCSHRVLELLARGADSCQHVSAGKAWRWPSALAEPGARNHLPIRGSQKVSRPTILLLLGESEL